MVEVTAARMGMMAANVLAPASVRRRSGRGAGILRWSGFDNGLRRDLATQWQCHPDCEKNRRWQNCHIFPHRGHQTLYVRLWLNFFFSRIV